jgi:PST family polysaccharide transporter
MTGYYAIADKVRVALTSLYSPISQALYPYIAKEKNIKLYRKLFVLIILLNMIGLAVLFVFTQQLMAFVFGVVSDETVMFMRIFVFVMLLDVPSILLGYPLLGAFGHTHYVNYSLVATAIAYLSGLALLYFSGVLSAEMVAYLYIAAIALELSLRVYGVRKFGLWSNDA